MSIQATQAAKRAQATADNALKTCDEIIAKITAVKTTLDEVAARVKALEDRPRPGRPAKDKE